MDEEVEEEEKEEPVAAASSSPASGGMLQSREVLGCCLDRWAVSGSWLEHGGCVRQGGQFHALGAYVTDTPTSSPP